MNRLSFKTASQQLYLPLRPLLSPPTRPSSPSPSPQNYHTRKAHIQCITTTRTCPKFGPPHSVPSWAQTQHLLNRSHPQTNGPGPHSGGTLTLPSTRNLHPTLSPSQTARNPRIQTAPAILRASDRGALSLQLGSQWCYRQASRSTRQTIAESGVSSGAVLGVLDTEDA